MPNALEVMLQKYNIQSSEDRKNALLEIVQEIALLGLFRSGFFNKAAFCGGTALRIFYGLDRFSEDLDFSLLESQEDFSLSDYTKYIQAELGAFGFDMRVEEKTKTTDTAIKSAFIKGGTAINLLNIFELKVPVSGIHVDQQIKIKLEVDTDPPAGANYEVKYQLNPVPYSVRIFSADSLFAGKIHAVLARSWSTRVKGRDYYDYIWYLSQDIPVNLHHLAQRLQQTGHWQKGETLNRDILIAMLKDKFARIDFEQAKQDVLPFIKHPQIPELWSEDFFQKVTEDKIRVIDHE